MVDPANWCAYHAAPVHVRLHSPPPHPFFGNGMRGNWLEAFKMERYPAQTLADRIMVRRLVFPGRCPAVRVAAAICAGESHNDVVQRG